MFKAQVDEIKHDIDQCLRMGVPPIAAFDADGTLWSHDVGEDFFNFQIRHNFLSQEVMEDPWKTYKALKAESPPKAYLWLAQINKGRSQDQMLQWSRDNVTELKQNNEFRPFEFQRELIQHLLSQEVSVYVVTASIKWAVMGAAEELGIPFDNVIGVSVGVNEKGALTDQQEGPITWKEGKVEGLLNRTNHIAPFYAAGNTMGDLALLESATNIKTTVFSAQPEDSLYETEKELDQISLKNNWYSFNFNSSI